MKKVYRVEDLDCANCAAKMECEIAKLKGVASASVSFMAQKITVETEEGSDLEGIEKQMVKVCRRVEPDCKIKV